MYSKNFIPFRKSRIFTIIKKGIKQGFFSEERRLQKKKIQKAVNRLKFGTTIHCIMQGKIENNYLICNNMQVCPCTHSLYNGDIQLQTDIV